MPRLHVRTAKSSSQSTLSSLMLLLRPIWATCRRLVLVWVVQLLSSSIRWLHRNLFTHCCCCCCCCRSCRRFIQCSTSPTPLARATTTGALLPVVRHPRPSLQRDRRDRPVACLVGFACCTIAARTLAELLLGCPSLCGRKWHIQSSSACSIRRSSLPPKPSSIQARRP